MTPDQINELIQRSLLEIHYRDSLLLKRLVKEECINHRLAFYLETIFEHVIHDDMFYCVDLEYDKNVSIKRKEIEIEPKLFISIRPDIIIHKRENNNDNLLAIESKIHALNTHDYLKLRKLLRPPYNYRYSAGITYNPGKRHFKYTLFTIENDKIESYDYSILKDK